MSRLTTDEWTTSSSSAYPARSKSLVIVVLHPCDGFFEGPHPRRRTERRAAVGGGAVGESSSLIQRHFANQPGQQRPEPGVAGPCRVDHGDLCRRHAYGLISVVQIAPLGVQL